MTKIFKIIFFTIILLTISCSKKKEKKIDSTCDYTTSSSDFDEKSEILFERISDNEIWIYNCFDSGFTREITLIKVNKDLEIKSVYYDYWIDAIDEIQTEFKVMNSKISFTKNPFKSNGQIEISYELRIDEVSYLSKKIINSKVLSFKTKCKALDDKKKNEYKIRYGFINSFNAYKAKYVDIKPELLSNFDTLRRELNPDFEINGIIVLLTVNTKGKVLKKSIKFRTKKKLTTEENDRIRNLLAKRLNYKPGYIDEIPVNTELYLII